MTTYIIEYDDNPNDLWEKLYFTHPSFPEPIVHYRRIKKFRTMDEEYGDGSNHIYCPCCGFCLTCGDCICDKTFGGEEIEE